MDFGKSKNPMFSEKNLAKYQRHAAGDEVLDRGFGTSLVEENMTVSGAVNKTFILAAVLLVSALFSYTAPLQIYLPIGALGAAGVYFYTSFKPQHSAITAPIFALLEGLFVGTISAIYAAQFAGIIFQALTATIGTLFMMLMIYRSGLIPITEKFRMGVSMAVGAVMLVYLASWIGHFVGFEIPYIHENGTIGIGITVVIIGVAALNLLLDFDNFDKGEAAKAPKYMEWFFGMGLLFTLVWLYVEFLRLISKLQSD